MFSLYVTDLRTQTHLLAVVSAVAAILGAVMTCAGVVQFVLCLQILFALMCGGFIWAVLNDRIPAKTGKGARFPIFTMDKCSHFAAFALFFLRNLI